VTIALVTRAAAETKAMAAVVAEHARPGDLVVLAGDLGAGKTTFAQGFASGLGVQEVVTSPTFTLAHAYTGRLVLNHVDVYRLEHLAEVADLALGEMIDSGGVTLIEWGDAILAALPPDYLEVRLQLGDGDDDRRVTVRAVGPTWAARQPALVANLTRWRP
jgi:tRNA threonylcarbamoyladenosine biosynthesis protein TsaE